MSNLNSCILAVGLQSSKLGGWICLYAIQGSRILRSIEIIDKVTSCCFINQTTCIRSDLNLFDGCIAVGTDTGKILLIDLALKRCREVLYGRSYFQKEFDILPCHIVVANVSFDEIRRQHKLSKKDDVNFGVQLEGLHI